MEENNSITPDVVEETTTVEETVDEVTAEPTETGTQEVATEAEPFMTIKYDKEDKPLTREEAIELTQKGMNYGRLEDKISAYESNPMYKWAEQYMKDTGFNTPEEFVAAVNKEKEEKEFESQVDKFKAIYGEEAAREMATMQKELKSIRDERNAEKSEKEKNSQYTELIEWHNAKHEKGIFSEKFNADNIPTEVWEAVNNGENLKTAYMEYQLDNMKVLTQQETIKKIESNAETSTGSIKQNNTTSEDGQFTREYIDQMTKGPKGKQWAIDNMDKIEKAGYFN